MKHKVWFVLCAAALLVSALLPTGVQPVLAQAPEPPQAMYSTRTGITASLEVHPLYLGGFTRSGENSTFNFKVTNDGELGDDTYDLSASSVWPVTFYNADGSTPLVDTDGDTIVDTGSVPQGAFRQVYARVTAPTGLDMGDENFAYITISSSLNPNETQTVQIDSSVPAPFSQVYTDVNDYGRISIAQNWPTAQFIRTVAEIAGSDLAVAETPSLDLVNIWGKSINGTPYGTILQYTLLSKYGRVTRPAVDLTQLDLSANYSNDINPVLASAPDGKVGIAWNHFSEKYQDDVRFRNYAVSFAILNSNGSLAYGPTNLTNIDDVCDNEMCDYYLYSMGSPAIAASEDNHFMVSWHDGTSGAGYSEIQVHTTIVASDGSVVVPAIPMDTIIDRPPPSTPNYSFPSVTALTGNRFLLAYDFSSYNPVIYNSIRYRIYDSAGNLLKDETNSGLYSDFFGQSYGVQLSDGNVLIAITYGGQVVYTVLDGLTLNPLGPFNSINHPSAMTGITNVSVTRDAADHGILTWQDSDKQYLYYALIDSNGTIISSPAISRTAKTGENSPHLDTSHVGAGVTTNSWSGQFVDTLLKLSGSYGAAPGGTAGIGVQYANNGTTTAASPQISVTLPAGLTYLGASPSVCTLGATLTCSLPDLAFGDSGAIQVYLGLPAAAPIGSTWVLQAVIGSSSVDANPADNSAEATIFAGLQVFLPSVLK